MIDEVQSERRRERLRLRAPSRELKGAAAGHPECEARRPVALHQGRRRKGEVGIRKW